MAELAVALLDGQRLAGPLAQRTGIEVAATTPDTHLEVAAALGREGRLVAGLATVPWPCHAERHAEGSATLPAYTGVVSWHALPALLDLLAHAVSPAATSGAHVLVTAPDPGPEAAAEDLTFLREVAAGIAARVDLRSSSIAWRGSTRGPSTVDALEAVVRAREPEGRRPDVLECPVAPGTGADPGLAAAGERLGVRVTTADLSRGSLLDLLATVVDTIAEHEGLEEG